MSSNVVLYNCASIAGCMSTFIKVQIRNLLKCYGDFLPKNTFQNVVPFMLKVDDYRALRSIDIQKRIGRLIWAGQGEEFNNAQ